jgi:hypothetical protein
VRCPYCQAPNAPASRYCESCGKELPRRDDPDFPERSDSPVSTIIPYKNPKALIAYYLGVFGLIPCVGIVLGPAAIVLGILGLRYVKKYPTAKGTGHAITGIVLGSFDTLYQLVGVLLMVVGAAMQGR